MAKFIAILLFLSLVPVAHAQCVDPSRIRLIDSGVTLQQLKENDAKFREEARTKHVPYLGPNDLAELTSHYRAGDLYYSYEELDPNGKALSGGTALVRSDCIVLLFPDWVA